MTGTNRQRRPVESFYAIRRADGQGLGFEEMYSWFEVDGPTDWSPAEEDPRGGVFEMLRVDVTVRDRRSFCEPDDLDVLAADLHAAWNATRHPTGDGEAAP